MAQIFMRSMLWQADQIFAVSSLSTLGVASGPIFMWSMLSQADQVFAVSSLSTLWVANGPNLYVEHAVTGWPNLSCIFTVHSVGSQWSKSLCGACCDRLTMSLLYLHCPHWGKPVVQSLCGACCHRLTKSLLYLHCPHCGYPMVQIFMWSMLWQADHFFAVSSLSTLWVANGPNLYVGHAVWQADQIFAVSSLSTLWVANGPNLYVEYAVTGWPNLCCSFTVHTVGSQWPKSSGSGSGQFTGETPKQQSLTRTCD